MNQNAILAPQYIPPTPKARGLAKPALVVSVVNVLVVLLLVSRHWNSFWSSLSLVAAAAFLGATAASFVPLHMLSRRSQKALRIVAGAALIMSLLEIAAIAAVSLFIWSIVCALQ